MVNQDRIFLNYEGNNWYERNKNFLKTNDQDLPLYLMELYNLKPKKVLEVGASNGYRLAEINKKFRSNTYAVESSLEAIRSGKKIYPFINFQRSTAEMMSFKKKMFDLIIINFVFHWMDRDNLLNSVVKINEVLDWGGYLIIGDFQTHIPIKKRYHHIKNKKIFTFKLDYKKYFYLQGFIKK